MLHALADSPQRSLFKLVCVGRANERVVGMHLLGEGADEILQGFAVALKRGITLARPARHDGDPSDQRRGSGADALTPATRWRYKGDCTMAAWTPSPCIAAPRRC